jgi:hypothetical protein
MAGLISSTKKNRVRLKPIGARFGFVKIEHDGKETRHRVRAVLKIGLWKTRVALVFHVVVAPVDQMSVFRKTLAESPGVVDSLGLMA